MDPKETREQFVRDAKSGLILDAARKIFAEKGFHETRLEEIALLAGFSKAALYNYYSDKESIFLSLANRDFDGLLENLKNNLTVEPEFIGHLEKNIRTVLSFFGEHFAFMIAMAQFRTAEKANSAKLSEYHEKFFCEFKNKISNVIDIFNETIKNAKEKGTIHCDLDNQTISSYIISIVKGVMLDWRMQGKKGDVDQEAGNIIVFLGRGLNFGPPRMQ
jgi:AcrR family transcriptional regulator